jgi:hypothetical protein
MMAMKLRGSMIRDAADIAADALAALGRVDETATVRDRYGLRDPPE